MRALAAIAVALALVGCTAGDSPLQRDLRQLADLPKRMDTLGRKDVAQAPVTVPPADAQTSSTGALAAPPPAAAAPALTPEPEQPVAAPETRTASTAPAVPGEPPITEPAQQVASAEPPAAQAAARVRKPTLLERIREATAARQQQTAAPPGPHDQIPAPIPVENPLARPPWEVFVEAGPNAHNELDLETLYGPGNIPPELMAEQQAQEQQADGQQADAGLATPPADTAAGQQASTEPMQKKAKPGAVAIKAVAVPAVTGATGSGNKELTNAMRDALQQAGWPILTAARADALTVRGRVAIGAAHGATQSVQIVWDVLTPDGKNLGNLKQDNAVPAGSLDASWGDNARYAAEAAADGIFTLIQKYR